MVRSYKLFRESYTNAPLDWSREVADICRKYRIRNWFINKYGLVDVDDNVDLNNRKLIKLPLKFGKISGNFECDHNSLESLDNFPQEIDGNLRCSHNNITSLIGSPKIGEDIFFSYNKLTSLIGCQAKVNGLFGCSHNLLTTLEGCPKEVVGQFWCKHNKLTSLEGLINANQIIASDNPISNLTNIGRTMINKKISFLEAAILHIKEIPDNELELIMKTINPQKILDLNDFRVFNLLRTHLPEKYKEVCALGDVDLSADLGELGF